jgi:hypothetical protein
VGAVGQPTLLMFNGCSDLAILELDQFRLLAVAMVSLQSFQCLVSSVVGNQPSGRLWQEPNRAELDETGCHLKQGRQSPRPGAGYFARSKGDPSSGDTANVPTRRSQHRAVKTDEVYLPGVADGSDCYTILGMR